MSDRRPLIMGNWKMNANHLEAIQMIQKLSYRLDQDDYDQVEVVVAPPFTAMRSVQIVLEQDHIPIGLGAQNCHWAESGAYTGEISPAMLRRLGATHIIVGHSERRQHMDETDEVVAKKAKAVVAADMTPVVCVGESLDQRESGDAEAVVLSQLAGSVRGLSPDELTQIVVAYEPVWAIGTGRTASADDAGSMAEVIRSSLRDLGGSGAAEVIRILYGGSVNAGNVKDIMAKRHVDGALVGGASLDPDKFAAIVRYRV